MFKKLHSNRDPKDTLLSEIKKEFGIYLSKIETALISFINRNPKPLFNTMIVLILVSIVLSFTVFRVRESKSSYSKPDTGHIAPEQKAKVLASDGFDKILRTGAALKETISLKQQIEIITSKNQLSAEDSAHLEKALDRLDELNKSLK